MASFKVVDLYDGSIQVAVPTSFIDARYVAIYDNYDQTRMIHYSSIPTVSTHYPAQSRVHINCKLGFEVFFKSEFMADTSTFQPQ